MLSAFHLIRKINCMATILPEPVGKRATKLHSVKIDMTPMVDLGFLLITFFIFTTSLSQPTVTKLVMPKESHQTGEVYEKTLLTAILDKDKLIVYEGAFEKALALHRVQTTTYDVQSGLGKIIRQKQQSLQADGLKEDLLVAIKPLPGSSYQNVVQALDEMLINGVKRYAIIGVSAEEKQHIAAGQQ